jgi:D-arabinose 1-dehydrogenase-like Zn-dependent alcohol dehydrogenase
VIRRVGIADRGGRFAAELRAEMESYWATTPADPMIVLTIRHVPVNDENDVIDGVRDLGLDPIVVINGDNEYDDDVEQGRPAGDAVAITLRRVRQSDVDRIAEMLQSIGVHSSLVISQASWAEVFDVIAEGEEATADPRPDIES